MRDTGMKIKRKATRGRLGGCEVELIEVCKIFLYRC